jgi:phage protein D
VKQEYHDIRDVTELIYEAQTDKKTKADKRKIKKRVENLKQAKEKGAAELYRLNRKKVTADVDIYGDPYMVAAININITGFGKFDGIYHIERSDHTLTKSSGYNTTLSLIKT